MMYKAKVAVCFEIRTKHPLQSEHHVEYLNGKPGGTYRCADKSLARSTSRR